VTCIPITLLWAHAQPLLLALGQAPAIVEGAARYLWIITPSVYMTATTECLKRYLVAQADVHPGMVITVLNTLAAPLWYWLLMFRWGCRAAVESMQQWHIPVDTADTLLWPPTPADCT
jgi:Na+-driven multidrug efflux pump